MLRNWYEDCTDKFYSVENATAKAILSDVLKLKGGEGDEEF